MKRRNIYMKYLGLTVIALCLLFAFQRSIAQNHDFGLGVILGEPTAFCAKLWTSNYNAFDFALGWSHEASQVPFHMDYLWHSFETIHSTHRFPLYYGFGLRFIGGGNVSSFAVRGVFGIAWMPHQTPIDFFLELAPSFQFTPSTGFALDAAIGARYYF